MNKASKYGKKVPSHCQPGPEQPRLGVLEDGPYLGQDRHSVG